MTDLSHLSVGSYWLACSIRGAHQGYVQAVRTVNREGVSAWAVRCRSMCMSRSGSWCYEPIPSSRTDAWIKSHRFPTAMEAVEAYNRRGRRNLERSRG